MSTPQVATSEDGSSVRNTSARQHSKGDLIINPSPTIVTEIEAKTEQSKLIIVCDCCD